MLGEPDNTDHGDIEETGGRDSSCTVVRELASQCVWGSIPAWCHMWVVFVVGSRLAPRVFPRVLQFSSLHKNQHSTRIGDPHETS